MLKKIKILLQNKKNRRIFIGILAVVVVVIIIFIVMRNNAKAPPPKDTAPATPTITKTKDGRMSIKKN